MSSNVLGRQVAKTALSYEGAKQGSKKHKELVDTFNKVHPNGQTASYSDAWCAITWTAVQKMCGNTQKDVPMGYNVPNLVTQAKKLGIWVESDSHIPRAGDGIVYDWQDNGKGDNKGDADHIGIVYKVDKGYIYAIEGNTTKRDERGRAIATKICAKRKLKIDGQFIRGFICPKYNAIYIDRMARKLSWKQGTDKAKYKVKGGKPNKAFRDTWKKYFPKSKYNSGCHTFVKLVLKVCGYRTMPLKWSEIIKYLRGKQRFSEVKFKGKASELRKGDVMIYRRVDSKGKHYHIWAIVEVNGKLCMAEANQGRYYAHQTKTLKKALKSYDKVWLFRPKEGKVR